MITLNMTKLEIIKEVVDFYEPNPSRRAIEQGTCKYLTYNGNKCALGRCFTDEAIEKYGAFQGSVTALAIDLDIQEEDFQLLLKEEYRGHNTLFWSNIQKYHDSYYFWRNENDSVARERFVNFILNQYAENED